MDDSLMTTAEVAELLRVSVSWVRQHSSGTRQPALPAVRFGAAVRFRRSAVMAWIEQQERAA